MNTQEITISVVEEGISFDIITSHEENILAALIRHGVYFSAACGGKGRCGKCKIRLTKGNLAISSSDEKYFSAEELAAGYRLACCAYPSANVSIVLEFAPEEDFEIQVGHTKEQAIGADKVADTLTDANHTGTSYDIAIDIGTTTIAFQLMETKGRQPINSYATLNRQRAYGADVISRIQASCEGKGDELRSSIQGDLLTGIKFLVVDTGILPTQIERIAIGANTTMGHLLMGYDCAGLGIYPFTPVDISLQEWTFEKVMNSDYCKAIVTLLPGISTYVGGDITAGLYSCGFDKNDDVCLLVDLGTNGEMAIGNRQRIVTTSTAAGPAFEGGNISWGMGSVKGAICHVEIEEDKTVVQTIGEAAPIGICGTGVIETIAELIDKEYVDETGRLAEEYFEEGFVLAKAPAGKKITFTQKDVREIQLAKSAVRAGIEVLLRRFGVTYEQVKKVYLAGGFGFHISQEKSMIIGLLPPEFAGKIDAVGNSSLGGALRYLQEDGKEVITGIREICEEIDLSTDADFNDLYMDYMFFDTV